MPRDDLLACIYQELREAEKALLFWKRQRTLRGNEAFGSLIEERVSNVQTSLRQLNAAKDKLTDA